MISKLMAAHAINRLLGVAWVIVLAFLFVLAIDSFIGLLGMDQPIFMYVAKGMLQGEVPYLGNL